MACLNTLAQLISNIFKRVIFFGRKSSIHGIKYVFEEKGTKLSKYIWLFILLLFTGCMCIQLKPVVQRGDTVNFTPDTRYLDWTTTFPAVTICEVYSSKNVLMKLSALNPDLMELRNFDSKRYVADLIYGRGSCSRSTCKPCGTLVPCNISWREIIDNVHKTCDEMISDCRFNNNNISCCKHFRAVDSEYGTCFSFNSLQSKYSDEYQFVVNRSTGPGILNFRLLSDSEVSVHSSEELRTNVLDKKLRFNVKKSVDGYIDYYFSIIEVENDPLLRDEAIDIRKCRYNNEIPRKNFHIYKAYSYGACRSANNIKKIYDQCHCVHPVRDIDYKNFYCNYTGLNCLNTYEALRTKLGKEDLSDPEDCLPSCVESEITTVYISKRRVNSVMEGSLVNIKMLTLPTLRYHHNLLRTKTDLVVTVGGMVGLFFSASILSLAEILYLVLRK